MVLAGLKGDLARRAPRSTSTTLEQRKSSNNFRHPTGLKRNGKCAATHYHPSYSKLPFFSRWQPAKIKVRLSSRHCKHGANDITASFERLYLAIRISASSLLLAEEERIAGGEQKLTCEPRGTSEAAASRHNRLQMHRLN